MTRTFGATTTADEVLEGIDLTGKRVLITGASGGLGAETARAMAARGAEVIGTTRATLELGSLASVRRFAEGFLAKYDTLDILINNAGIMACPQGTTEDGFELQFGCNHLGHFLLTTLLARSFRRGGRVVCVSSLAHHISPVMFEDLQFERRPYDKWQSYGQSKTANALFAVALNERWEARGVEAFSLHPGAIETDLGRHQSDADRARSRAARESGKLVYKSIPAGAATQVFAATAPELAGKGGAYLVDCAIASVTHEAGKLTGVRPYAIDPIAADRLWTISEELVRAR